jgi:hypothetical protein
MSNYIKLHVITRESLISFKIPKFDFKFIHFNLKDLYLFIPEKDSFIP